MAPRTCRLEALHAQLRSCSRAAIPPPPGPPASTDSETLPPPFSNAELHHWRERGYVVLRGAVPEPWTDAVAADIWALAERSPRDRAGWYAPLPPHATRSGTRTPYDARTTGPTPTRGQADLEVHMLSLWQQQSVWDVRQQPRIHAAFAQLWGTQRLWVSVDCANLKPPIDDLSPGFGSCTYLHYDWSLESTGTMLGIQGALMLADTGADGGGFRCIPGFSKRLEAEPAFLAQCKRWRAAAPDNAAGGSKDLPELTGMPVETVAGRKGDLVIWNSLLPHGNGEWTFPTIQL
jgi:ectoine hydroxylase-related dioxygenase (phytanoyl-CoA dioxygenase family)